MADFEPDNMSGFLFKNEYKKAEKHPDYRGTVKVEGKKLEIAAWVKKGKKGSFMSLVFQEPYVKPDAYVTEEPQDDFEDEDIPF